MNYKSHNPIFFGRPWPKKDLLWNLKNPTKWGKPFPFVFDWMVFLWPWFLRWEFFTFQKFWGLILGDIEVLPCINPPSVAIDLILVYSQRFEDGPGSWDRVSFWKFLGTSKKRMCLKTHIFQGEKRGKKGWLQWKKTKRKQSFPLKQFIFWWI